MVVRGSIIFRLSDFQIKFWESELGGMVSTRFQTLSCTTLMWPPEKHHRWNEFSHQNSQKSIRDHAKITSREEGEGFGLFATKVHRSIREGEGVRKSPIL